MNKIDIINVRFGRLVVLRQEGKYKSGTKLYICLCDCGKTCQTSLSHLRNAEVKSCGCLAKEASSKNGKLGIKNILGQKFGKLTVIDESDHTVYGIKWKCQCDCGNFSIVLGTNLRKSSGTISCGCANREALIKIGKIRRLKNPWAAQIYQYQSGAFQRKLEFNLSEDQFKSLVLNNCFYCGITPQTQCQGAELKEQKILRNGIDRLNPDIGYTNDNCVSCCWTCNESKSNKTYSQFLYEIKIRYEHLLSKGIIKMNS